MVGEKAAARLFAADRLLRVTQYVHIQQAELLLGDKYE